MRCERRPLAACLLLVGVSACEPAPLDEPTPYEGTPMSAPCAGNNDGVITADEMPFVIGARARFRIGGGGSIALDAIEEDGVPTWDLTRPDPVSEPLARIGPDALSSTWIADAFPEASIAAPLDPAGETIGAVAVDEDGVTLWGFASSRDEAPRTLASYDAPVILYPFPLHTGARRTTTARATDAELLGIPSAFEDTYDVEVTGKGTLKLPDLVLENTLKVTVRFSRVLLAGDLQQVTHIFVHECLGEVARVRSEIAPLDDTLDDDFPVALDVWRLAL